MTDISDEERARALAPCEGERCANAPGWAHWSFHCYSCQIRPAIVEALRAVRAPLEAELAEARLHTSYPELVAQLATAQADLHVAQEILGARDRMIADQEAEIARLKEELNRQFAYREQDVEREARLTEERDDARHKLFTTASTYQQKVASALADRDHARATVAGLVSLLNEHGCWCDATVFVPDDPHTEYCAAIRQALSNATALAEAHDQAVRAPLEAEIAQLKKGYCEIHEPDDNEPPMCGRCLAVERDNRLNAALRLVGMLREQLTLASAEGDHANCLTDVEAVRAAAREEMLRLIENMDISREDAIAAIRRLK